MDLLRRSESSEVKYSRGTEIENFHECWDLFRLRRIISNCRIGESMKSFQSMNRTPSHLSIIDAFAEK